MTSIKRLERYLEKVFDWSARVAGLQDGRCFAQVPLSQVFEAVFWGTVLRHKSLHSIVAECREGVLCRRIGAVSESTVGYALERMEVQSLRELSFAVTRKLKRNGVLQWATAAGQLVVALDGIEVFCSERRRCAKCSVRTKWRGEEQVQEYYHRVVVASLVGFGFRLVVDLELVEPGENEVAAGERVLRRMIQHLGPRFFQIVVADALYANAPFLHIVQQLGLDLVATLKENQSDLLAQAKGWMDRPPDQTFHRDARTHYAILGRKKLVGGRDPRIDPSDSSAKTAVGHRVCGWQQAAPSSESPPVLPHHLLCWANQRPQHLPGGGSALGVRNIDFFPMPRPNMGSSTLRYTAGNRRPSWPYFVSACWPSVFI